MDIIDFARGLQASSDNRGQRTYIMYHGTTLQNALKIKRDGFVPSPDGMLGRGVYVSRSFQKASAYPKKLKAGEERVVLMLKVRVGRVKRIDRQNHPLQKSWHQAGYDTAWVPPNCGMVPSGLEEDCVWDPDRIEVMEILNMDGSVKDDSVSLSGPTTTGDKRNRTALSVHLTITPKQRLLHLSSSGSDPFGSHDMLNIASNSSSPLCRHVIISTLSRSPNSLLPSLTVRTRSLSSLFSPSDSMLSPIEDQMDLDSLASNHLSLLRETVSCLRQRNANIF